MTENHSQYRLSWQDLTPDLTHYQTLLSAPTTIAPLFASQKRLAESLQIFCHADYPSRFMLLKADEEQDILELLRNNISDLLPAKPDSYYGGHYQITDDNQVTLTPAQQPGDFVGQGGCFYQEWIEPHQLFGCVQQFAQRLHLQPGLLHRANGGVLLLTLKSLLIQPLMWLRLKQMIINQRYQWLANDDQHPLPVAIADLPLNLRVILVGDRQSLAEFQAIEPIFYQSLLYGEFEDELLFTQASDLQQWRDYLRYLCQHYHYPQPTADCWPLLIKHAVRYTADQYYLPLTPHWLKQPLTALALQKQINAPALQQVFAQQQWRESYLAERSLHEILSNQTYIDTEGEAIGQINGLTVIEYPGHPRPLGEPARISCVVHIGDGDITDVERKVDLGGSLHAKGMMIMQAFLSAELQLDQPLPFSASIVFEQSYGEIDGDSASLAELTALISALTGQAIKQSIAVTGSVDQFGNIQAIGGINEKITGFFTICQQRGLTGQQGVILPITNIRHLCLDDAIIEAVKQQQFHLWAVEHVSQALPLLMGLAYYDSSNDCLLNMIKQRIIQMGNQENKPTTPPTHWLQNWRHWFTKNQGQS